MSTMYISIHDLLRVTYTYEARAIEARSRSDSTCSNPDHCTHMVPPTPRKDTFTNLETDFTHLYASKKRDSAVAMT